MRVVVAWWDLAGSHATIDALRTYLWEEAIDAWSQVEGLALKLWVADRERDRWGAVMVWESDRAGRTGLPAHRAAELIGYGPTSRTEFTVEATVAGSHDLASLAGLGSVFEKREPYTSPPVAQR